MIRAWLLRVLPLALVLSPAIVAGQVVFTTTVEAPDGTALATDVYLPAGAGPWPTLLIRTPYGKGELNGFCSGFAVFAYSCVAQDTRGRFDSEGIDTVFADDGVDGRATLDWIVDQAWNDGNIGTFGASALGITQYVLAPGATLALKAQMVFVATPDLYRDGVFQRGAMRESLIVNWLAGQDASERLEDFKTHRLLDPWWESVRPITAVDSVEVPVLHLGGWYDVFQQGTLDAFASAQHAGGGGALGRQVVRVGPWTHGGFGLQQAGELTYPPNAVYDWGSLALDWFDYWLKGQATGVDSWPSVEVYLMGAVDEPGAPGNDWTALHDWPPAATLLRFYLTADNGLSATRPPSAAVSLVADPDDPVPTLGGPNLFPDLVVDGRPMGAGPYDQRPIEARADVVTFTTDPLTESLHVVGPLNVTVGLTADSLDADLAVRLTDVYPDGRSMLVADGIARARTRCGEDTECLLTPGVTVQLEVDLWSTAMVFNAGHRLRLAISGSNAPRFEVNPNNGDDLNDPGPGIVANLDLAIGGAVPSFIELPLLGELFADGFESGDTSRWTVTVPAG